MVGRFSARKSRDCLAMASQAIYGSDESPKHQNTPMFLLNIELDSTIGLSFFVIPVLDTICVILRVNG